MTDPFENELLSRALKTVAEAAVPDSVVPDVSEIANWELVCDQDADWEEVEAEWLGSPGRRRLGSPGRRRLGRSLGAAVAVLALGAAGTGIAAAAGAFTTAGVELIAPAIGQILPTGRWSAANVTTRLSEPGPDGSSLTLLTASADSAGGCMRLVVSVPGAPPDGGTVACSEAYNTLRPPTTHTPTSTAYGTATKAWTSPAGTQWLFVYGRAQTPSAARIGAVSKTGTVLATAPISNGWFILAVETSAATAQQAAGRHLVYYGATGRQTGAYPTL